MPLSLSRLRKTLTIVLAGGVGERLYPLTKDRSKPSVPFGGPYRIIDFTLSNCLNSGFHRIYLLTQYLAQSLMEHIYQGWNVFPAELGAFIHCVSPQHKIPGRWYEGTADAVFHNLNLLSDHQPEHVLILSGDHIYKMDYAELLEFHIAHGAQVTLATLPVPRAEASRFGIVQAQPDGRVTGFLEKPADPPPMPDRSDRSLANMGIYLFNTSTLARALSADAKQNTAHDFGRNLLPALSTEGGVWAFPFRDQDGKPEAYWRDIGTLDSYYEANMDLVSVEPEFNLYADSWPIRTRPVPMPPAKFVFAQSDAEGGRRGQALDAIVCAGAILSGGQAERSIIGPGARLNSFSRIEGSILFDNVQIGRHARIRNAILDKNVRVPEGFRIGYDAHEDARRFVISPGGVVVVPKNTVID